MVFIAFAGGGTGGHIYPGLAVAKELQKILTCRIFWIGSAAGMDRSIVEKAGFEFFGIPAGKLRRYISVRNFPDAFKVVGGIFAARRILGREKPALLFSKGGFVSVPPCMAAASLGIPVFTHESDYSPGLATRINTRFAKKIFTAFPQTAGFLPEKLRSRVETVGNPIRPEFRAADPRQGRAFLGLGEGEPVLLVLGGSLGARQLNELIRENLGELTKQYVVVHQTGPASDLPGTTRYRPFPFIREELPHVIAAADLVVCRAGAGTLWENAALGKAMILVPLAGSGTRGDQVENARCLEQAGAALVFPAAARPCLLADMVKTLAADRQKRLSLGKAAARFAATDGAALIARSIRDFLEGSGEP
ncbi:MAG: undecaprenyldiphospho-muramoylpentapeptide beta-N-acetylglucosaminyltransferase [Spirochaetaceae bacterium]|jgi:UDP-N-acetylglucosamine--N-acetylmuramyl-(pentapeptide) pyrophosphoryl-undecaprenol N-acetylglucosamine transferase|nr:undecaprenyldiphospho-muramoylpentapeptide beta-N-acetylglucosaminyltransferase [Spirochaetaceae bacterium]